MLDFINKFQPVLAPLLSLWLVCFYPFSVAAKPLSLHGILTHTQLHNPEILSAQAELNAAEAGVDTARSGYRPSITASGQMGRSSTRYQGNPAYPDTTELQPSSVSIDVTQPLFHGFKTNSAVDSALATAQAQRATLMETEQQILYKAAESFFGIIEAEKILALTQENEQVLKKQLFITKDRLRVGDLKKTDVAQAQARYQTVAVSRKQAERNLANAHATFKRVIGFKATELKNVNLTFDGPSSPEDILALAKANNPSISKARYSHEASDADISAAQGELWPQIDLVGRAERAWDQGATAQDRQDTATIMVRATLPLYQGGANYSRIRSANHVRAQRQQQAIHTEQQVQEMAMTSWHNLQTAKETIKGRHAVVQASTAALKGVRIESKYGTRTILDVLNAEQELLDAKINKVRAERDKNLAILQLKVVIGALTAKSFGPETPLADNKVAQDGK